MYKLHNKIVNKEKRKSLRKNMTPQEVIVWSRLRRGQLGYKFRRQHGIGNYTVDFFCAEKNLIIEIDGFQHMNDYDKKRDEFLRENGFTVLRFWNNEVNNNLEGVIQKIISFLQTPQS